MRDREKNLGMIREHGFDTVKERRLFSIHISTPGEFPANFVLPSSKFVCLLAWEAKGVPHDAIAALVEALLRAGASYFVCWGADCERVHDVIDEMVSVPGNDFGVPEEACIMTSWHDNESLGDAIWFFLYSTWPDDHYFDSTHAALAMSVGCTSWAGEIEAALDHPDDFIKSASRENS
jgi:hypothetical protein